MDIRLFRVSVPRRMLLLVLILAGIAMLACDLGTLIGGIGTKPTVQIDTPASGSQFREGEQVTIQSTAKDSAGIVRVELGVDGAAFRSDAPPVAGGQASFTVVQKWQAIPGTHTLSVRAYNTSGAASDPALVTVMVTPSGAGSGATPTGMAAIPGTELAITPIILPSPTLESLSTPAVRPPTRVPATPTLAAPPGVYATAIRVDPPDPKRGAPPVFRVTFVNTTGKAQQYRWFVKIYEPDKPNSKGETSKLVEDIPMGTSERPSPADWTLRGPGPCEPFIARVFWFDRETSQTTEFIKPDKSGGPATAFQVCP